MKKNDKSIAVVKPVSLILATLVFIFIVDPPNVLFKVKDVIFVLLLFFCVITYRSLNYRLLFFLLSIYFVEIITFLRGVIAGYAFDYTFSVFMFKTFLPLILLAWVGKFEILTKIYFPAAIVAFFTIIVTAITYSSPELRLVLYDFFSVDKPVAAIGTRSFLGVDVPSVYYVSLPLLFIPFSLSAYKAMFEKGKKFSNILLTILFSIALLCGGTRASMLSVILVFAILSAIRIAQSPRMLFVLMPLILVGVSGFLYIVFLLASEKTETSIAIKYGHLQSYQDFFSAHFDALFWGQGVGALFYSVGFKEYAVQTEWTLFEFIRYFGLFGTLVVLSVYAFPLYVIYNKRAVLPYWFPIILGYAIYFLIGTTNPLLVSSNGMLAVLTVFSYAYNNIYEQR